MKPILRRIVSYVPTPEWVLNHVVNRLPYASWRMRAYKLLGVRLEAPRTGCIMLGTKVHSPRRLSIGRNSVIGPGGLLDARGGIEIGRNVNITGDVRFMTAKHIVQDPGFDAVYEPIVIGDRAWVALGATVLGGVTIGEGAVVAAGATVTHDVAPFTIVAGTPAAKVGTRTQDLDYELWYRPNWA